MLISTHSIGDDSGEQALDGREQSNCERGRKQRQNVRSLEIGERKMRKAPRNTAKLTSNRLDGQVKNGYCGR